jgi:hypothetical protein
LGNSGSANDTIARETDPADGEGSRAIRMTNKAQRARDTQRRIDEAIASRPAAPLEPEWYPDSESMANADWPKAGTPDVDVNGKPITPKLFPPKERQ